MDLKIHTIRGHRKMAVACLAWRLCADVGRMALGGSKDNQMAKHAQSGKRRYSKISPEKDKQGGICSKPVVVQ